MISITFLCRIYAVAEATDRKRKGGGVSLHAANLLVGTVLARQHKERRLNHAATETKHQVKG